MQQLTIRFVVFIGFIFFVILRMMSVTTTGIARSSATVLIHVATVAIRLVISTVLIIVIVILLAAKLVRSRRHAQVFRDRRIVIALGARNGLVLLVLEPFTFHVIFAVTGLAAQARVLSQSIARLALEVLRLQHLTRRLVLELVVLAEVAVAEATLEHPSAMVPDSTFAFLADSILKGEERHD